MNRLYSVTRKIFSWINKNIQYVVLFGGLTIHFWYVILNISSTLYGGPGDHTAGLIWLYETDSSSPWWNKSSMSAAPFGENLWNPAYIFSQLVYIIFWVAATATQSGIAGYNIITILGFMISYLVFYRVAIKLINGPKLITALVSYLVSFTPFALFLNGVGHLSYIIAPAYVALLLYMTHNIMNSVDIRKSVTISGILLGGAWVIDPYFVLFGFMTWGAILVSILVSQFSNIKSFLTPLKIKAVIATILIALAMYVPLIVYARVNAEAVASNVLSVRADIKEDANQYSARLKDYLLPSASNPLVPKSVKELKEQSFHGNDPTFTLYGGVLFYLLIIFCFCIYIYQRLNKKVVLPSLLRLSLACCLAATILFLFSLPPTFQIGDLSIAGPNSMIIAVTGIWRVFSRLFIFFYPLIGIAFLACYVWLSEVWDPKKKIIYSLTIILLAGTSISMLPRDPFDSAKFWSLNADIPSTYTQVKNDSDIKILAEYPLREAPHYKGSMYFSGQLYHHKAIFNASKTFTETSTLRQSLSDLSNKQTIPALKFLGVDAIQIWQAKYGQKSIDDANTTLVSQQKFTSIFGQDTVKLYKLENTTTPQRYIVRLDWDSRVWNDEVFNIRQKLPIQHSLSVADLCMYLNKQCLKQKNTYSVTFTLQNTSNQSKKIQFRSGEKKYDRIIEPGENIINTTMYDEKLYFSVSGGNPIDSEMFISDYNLETNPV